MKKLMFAATAIAAGVAMADVTSANVVGYMNKETNEDGHTLLAGSFLNVASTDSFTLGELSATGYDPEEGAWGELTIKILDSAGLNAVDEDGNVMIFNWKDNEDDGTGWFNDDDDKWDNSYALPAGQGFWVEGSGQTLVGAGAVNFEPLPIPTYEDGHTLCGNPYPCEIKLADMSASGYDPEEGAWGELTIKILDSAGLNKIDDDGNIMIFNWKDNEDDGTGWFNDDDDKWDDSYALPAGQGFWVEGSGQTLEFTFPKASK